MGWHEPKTKIQKLTPNTVKQTDSGTGFVKLEAIGNGFNLDNAFFIFVMASKSDLKDQQLIPCEDVVVEELADAQKITFKISPYEREAGEYDLIGWSPAEKGKEGDAYVNNATVMNGALTVESKA